MLESQIVEKNRKKSTLSATSNIERLVSDTNNNTNANILENIFENLEILNKKADNILQQKLLLQAKSSF